jgi:hypothetical protein
VGHHGESIFVIALQFRRHRLAPVRCLLQATLNIQALLQGMTLDGHQAIRATLLELFASAAMELISK